MVRRRVKEAEEGAAGQVANRKGWDSVEDKIVRDNAGKTYRMAEYKLNCCRNTHKLKYTPIPIWGKNVFQKKQIWTQKIEFVGKKS